MNISKFSDYSMRVLMYLSDMKGQRITVEDLAEKLNVSRNHLVKVVHFLSQKEIVKSSRGRSGGIWLNRAPKDIRLGDLMQLTENLSLVDCMRSREDDCPMNACRLKAILQSGSMIFVEYLNDFTLADLSLTRQEPASKPKAVTHVIELMSDVV